MTKAIGMTANHQPPDPTIPSPQDWVIGVDLASGPDRSVTRHFIRDASGAWVAAPPLEILDS